MIRGTKSLLLPVIEARAGSGRIGATARRLLLPGVTTVAMLIVLLGLGTWQVHRLAWKTALLDQIDHAESSPPVALSDTSAPFTPAPVTPAPVTPAPFTKVSAIGTFLPGETSLYGIEVRDTASGPMMGARMIEPLRQTTGEVILVDRGWVPLSRTGPIDEPSGTVTVSGYVRFGDQAGWFSVKDDPAARRFFTLNPVAIGAAIGRPEIRPFVLVVLASGKGTANHWPQAAEHMPRPPNNHLSYAITWYGLALALVAIFVVWVRKGSRA